MKGSHDIENQQQRFGAEHTPQRGNEQSCPGQEPGEALFGSGDQPGRRRSGEAADIRAAACPDGRPEAGDRQHGDGNFDDADGGSGHG